MTNKIISRTRWSTKAEKIAKKAVKDAIALHFREGNPVYVSKNQQIIRINPDGSRRKLSN